MEGRVSCGKSYNESLDSQIKEEARDFNDILAGNFRDTYINLVIKLFMGFAWAKKINCRFVLKADDDVYVHLPKLISWYSNHLHAFTQVMFTKTWMCREILTSETLFHLVQYGG